MDVEVLWNGQRDVYLCVPPAPDPPRMHYTAPRERLSSAPILALFAQYGPMTIRTLQTHTSRQKLYALVDMLRRRGKVIVFARSSAGILYSLPLPADTLNTEA